MRINGKDYKPTFHVSNAPIARKAWKCTLCGEPVEIGKRYVRYTWRKWDSIDDLPFHAECWSVLQGYCKAKDTNLFTPEDIREWLKQSKPCSTCKDECHIHTCQKVLKLVKHKPIMSYYDKLKPMKEVEENEEQQD